VRRIGKGSTRLVGAGIGVPGGEVRWATGWEAVGDWGRRCGTLRHGRDLGALQSALKCQKKCPQKFLGHFSKVPNLLVSLKVFRAL
jgi:hypothetical protein